MTSEALVTIIGAVLGSGALTAVLTSLANRRKSKADAGKTYIDGAQVLSSAALALLAPFQAQVDRLASQVEKLTVDLGVSRTEVAALTVDLGASRHEVDILTRYIEELIGVLRARQLPIPPRPDRSAPL